MLFLSQNTHDRHISNIPVCNRHNNVNVMLTCCSVLIHLMSITDRKSLKLNGMIPISTHFLSVSPTTWLFLPPSTSSRSFLPLCLPPPPLCKPQYAGGGITSVAATAAAVIPSLPGSHRLLLSCLFRNLGPKIVFHRPCSLSTHNYLG